MFDYIEMFYNPKRKHTTNGMLSPINFEAQQQKPNKANVQETRAPQSDLSPTFLGLRGEFWGGFCALRGLLVQSDLHCELSWRDVFQAECGQQVL